MSREKISKQEKISIFEEIAKGCKTDLKKKNVSIHQRKHFYLFK